MSTISERVLEAKEKFKVDPFVKNYWCQAMLCEKMFDYISEVFRGFEEKPEPELPQFFSDKLYRLEKTNEGFMVRPWNKPEPDTEKKLRELLWLNHGCMGLYGDDGEMQCNCAGVHIPIDFKRDSVLEIENKLMSRNLKEPEPEQKIEVGDEVEIIVRGEIRDKDAQDWIINCSDRQLRSLSRNFPIKLIRKRQG